MARTIIARRIGPQIDDTAIVIGHPLKRTIKAGPTFGLDIARNAPRDLALAARTQLNSDPLLGARTQTGPDVVFVDNDVLAIFGAAPEKDMDMRIVGVPVIDRDPVEPGICVVDSGGAVLRRDVVASDPDVLAKWLDRHCLELGQVVLETGPLSTFLYHGLKERDVPVECICARHAKGVLATRVNKSDVHDAEGLAQLARTGWFKRVHMKASATHIDRAALRIRAQLITARNAMANQMRGLLNRF